MTKWYEPILKPPKAELSSGSVMAEANPEGHRPSLAGVVRRARKVVTAANSMVAACQGPAPEKGTRAHNELYMARDYIAMELKRLDAELTKAVGKP